MSKKTVQFLGIVANADPSLLNVKLEHGFRFENLSWNQGIDLISAIEKYSSVLDIATKLNGRFPCYHHDSKSFICVTNSFEADLNWDEHFVLSELPKDVLHFHNHRFDNYLHSVIRLMNLFKEGNIQIPLLYYYGFESIPRRILQNSSDSVRHSSIKYSLTDFELEDLQKFIKSAVLPFKQDFLGLAFDNFEMSYLASNLSLQFLPLMISLETLLNPGESEVSYRISRNLAVLLGKDANDSKAIYDSIKKLYSKRSKLVHTGSQKSISEKDVEVLRFYVRESIKNIYETKLNKNDLLEALNSNGFGVKEYLH